MLRYRRAVFCYYILDFAPAMHTWLLLLTDTLRRQGLISLDSTMRQQTAIWLSRMFTRPADFETVLHVLLGDAFFERNKQDVLRLEREVGRPVISLWDTDPIFDRYPHLRGLGRNLEFEQRWQKMKSADPQKQK